MVRDSPTDRLASALHGAARGDSIFDDVVGRGLIHELLDEVHETNRAREERARKRQRIRSVLLNGELDVVFQPIVDLATREVVGHEALSRFASHPTRGPQQWFAEAQSVGLGAELELWAVRMACERSRGLPAGTFMAVNVSPATAERPDLLRCSSRRTWTTWCSR